MMFAPPTASDSERPPHSEDFGTGRFASNELPGHSYLYNTEL